MRRLKTFQPESSVRRVGLAGQGGQALVEFAIISILLVLLIAGGIELALAAFASQRTSDGARSGAETWIAALDGAGVYDAGGPDFTIPSGQGLGDHTAGFVRPACDIDPSTYDDGLPADSVTQGGDKIYLFNPLPIDRTLCDGQDGTDPSRSRISVLIDSLPPMNQAMYSQYQLRCGDAGGTEVACSDGAAVEFYYRLPGWLDTADDRVYVAMLDADPDSPTFQVPLPDSPRPTFALECAPAGSGNFADCDAEAAPADVCWSTGAGTDPFACDVRVQTRFRYIFHAFLQYPFVLWQDPLPAAALAQMDSGPAGTPQGVVGSEVARGGVRRFQRTFLGCWETLTAPPSAGMLGNRTTRACN